MSSTVSTASAVPTACTNLYNTPNQDNTCAMPYKKDNVDIMEKCCGDAKLVAYYNDCGIYCVALDQTIGDLAKCLFKNGAPDADVFCSGSKKTTKTKDADVPATAQASVINGDDKDKDDDDKSTASGTSTETSTGSSSSSTSTESGNAAPSFAAKSSINTVGLAIGALLLSSFAAGAFQL